MADVSLGLFKEDNNQDVSLGLFDDDVSMGLFEEEPKPAVGKEDFYTITDQGESYPTDMAKDIEPLPEANVSPTALKSAAAFGYGAAAFIPSGLAGTVMGLFKETPAEDRSLDIPGEPSVGGKIEFDPDLKRAAEWVETIGGKVPAMIMEGDEQAIENVERVMGPLNKAWRYWGDTVEKTYLNQMEAGEVPYDRQKAADMGALTATVLEGGFWILGPKFLKDMKVKIK